MGSLCTVVHPTPVQIITQVPPTYPQPRVGRVGLGLDSGRPTETEDWTTRPASRSPPISETRPSL